MGKNTLETLRSFFLSGLLLLFTIQIILVSCSDCEKDTENYPPCLECTFQGTAHPLDSLDEPDIDCPIPEELNTDDKKALEDIVRIVKGTWIAENRSVIEVSCSKSGEAVVPLQGGKPSCLPWKYPIEVQIGDRSSYGVASMFSADARYDQIRIAWGFDEPYRKDDHPFLISSYSEIDTQDDETAWTLTVEEDGEKIVYRKQED